MQLLDDKRSRLLERSFWLALAALGAYEAFRFRYASAAVTALAVLVCAAALAPAFLWLRRKAPGYPLFPTMATTYLWTYGLPALNQQFAVAVYPASRQVAALAAALVFLVVATLTWLAVVRLPAYPPRQLLQFDRRATVPTLLAGLAAATLLQLNGSLQVVPVPRNYASVLTALSIAAVSVASPTLAFLLGQGKLTRGAAASYVALMGVYLVSHLSSLHLTSVVTMGISVLTYSIARGRVPFAFALGLLVAFTVLQLGKAEMRGRYWGRQQGPVKPWDYPAFFEEWADAGLRHAVSPEAAPGDRAVQGPLERSSLLWVMLRLQDEIPARKPFLLGETYELILPLLVPRLLNDSKIAAIRGNQVLAVYAGIVRKEDADRVAIGFGYLAEAYANFGWTGIVVLAVVLGALLAQLTRWSLGAPVISFRGTFAILALVACFQTESTAGGFISALFQQSLVLVALSCALMRLLPTSPAGGGETLSGRTPGARRSGAGVAEGVSPALP
jgi:hypothetical protein